MTNLLNLTHTTRVELEVPGGASVPASRRGKRSYQLNRLAGTLAPPFNSLDASNPAFVIHGVTTIYAYLPVSTYFSEKTFEPFTQLARYTL